MSTEAERTGFRPAQEVFGDVRANWGWLLALGIVFVILGFIGLGMTFAVTMASVLMYGVLLLIGAGAQFVDAAKCKGWKGIIWHVLIALLYAVAGIAVIADPLAASAILTLMLAGGTHCCRPGEGYYGLSDASGQELVLAAFGWNGLYHPGRHHHGQLAGIGSVDNRALRFNRIDGERLVVHLCRAPDVPLRKKVACHFAVIPPSRSGNNQACLEREDIPSAVDRAASNKERVKVVCSGKEIAAVVPLEDLELLEEIEDRLDLLEPLESITEAKGFIPNPWIQSRTILAALGLSSGRVNIFRISLNPLVMKSRRGSSDLNRMSHAARF